EERLTPKLQDTAKHLWFIYSGLALACGLSYHAAGMGWFDALCHSFSTVSLGGFSTRGGEPRPLRQPRHRVGGRGFLGARGGQLRPVLRRHLPQAPGADPEGPGVPVLRADAAPGGVLHLPRTLSPRDIRRRRGAGPRLFQAASVMSDNGLAAANYPNWPEHLVLLLLYEQSIRELKQLIHPNGVYATKVGGKPVPERIIRSVWSLFFFYIFFACVFTWGLVAAGHDFFTAFGTVAACFNNMGIGYGDTASTFATLSEGGKWLMCLAMLFGRLEIFPILIVFSRSFWRS